MGKVSRRGFLKLSAAGAGGGSLLMAAGLGPEGAGAVELHKKIGESYTICPYCSVGCGLIVATDEAGHVTNSEGDPDHIVNRGALDPKSVAVRQLSDEPAAPAHGEVPRSWAPPSGRRRPGTGRSARSPAGSRRRAMKPGSSTVKVGGKDVACQPHRGSGLAGRRCQQQ